MRDTLLWGKDNGETSKCNYQFINVVVFRFTLRIRALIISQRSMKLLFKGNHSQLAIHATSQKNNLCAFDHLRYNIFIGAKNHRHGGHFKINKFFVDNCHFTGFGVQLFYHTFSISFCRSKR